MSTIIVLDLETTSLNPEVGQVLEIGAIAYNPERRAVLSEFSHCLYHPIITGEEISIQMAVASGLLAEPDKKHPAVVEDLFEDWLWTLGGEFRATGPFYAMGFNVGSFDLQWKLDKTKLATYFHHRTIELGSLLMNFMDTLAPVSSKQAAEELFPRRLIEHRALSDARFALECFKATRSD